MKFQVFLSKICEENFELEMLQAVVECVMRRENSRAALVRDLKMSLTIQSCK